MEDFKEKEKFYYFQISGADTLAQTLDLDAEAMGCLFIFNCYLCSKNRIPKCRRQLSQICKGAKAKSISAALRHMTEVEDGYVSMTIINAKIRAKDIAEKRQVAGLLGAASKWGKR